MTVLTKRQAVTHGKCKDCGQDYYPGDWIVRVRLATFVHLDCVGAGNFDRDDK